ncbi:hypothetical protein L9F63_014791 [Diploptera punctata]|uniref:Peptidase S1 domain-containing protein n=1 Tax=Diploptera punctata TaxID=6984 RepID=A0AAD8EKL1_DIPPU|nr:hypothetical protein L9F63_014791 [Diploptera punctata]
MATNHLKSRRVKARPIVGGVNANIATYPYQVSTESSISHFCGASIISLSWVLCAAHCLDNRRIKPQFIGIRVGSSIRDKGGKIYAVDKIITHAKFSERVMLDYDIGLIKVKQPFEYGPTVQPISLNTQRLRPGMLVTVTGWGVTTMGGDLPEILQKVEVPMVPYWECQWLYGKEKLTENMFCAGRAGYDACQGDSGGPVVYDGHQIGVVSWGEGCALPGYPGIYTDVAKFRDWIRENSGLNSLQVTSPATNRPRSRYVKTRPIVGGVNADIATYPYQVSVSVFKEKNAASIISVNWVLCAAHCFVNPTVEPIRVGIRVGSSTRDKGGKIYTVDKLIIHAKYNERVNLMYDIALIKVKQPFEFGPTVQPILLNRQRLRPGMLVTVTGWGHTTMQGELSEILQKIEVPLVPYWECEWLYGKEELTEGVFCAGRAGYDACQGDSGGPIVYDGHQIGVVSWGIGCALSGYPGIYTDVAKYRKWIRENSGHMRFEILSRLVLFISVATIFVTAHIVSLIYMCRRESSKRLKSSRKIKPIVGGEPAEVGKFPYQVQPSRIETEEATSHFCGGSIISVDWVLTAAHCMASEEPDKVSIRIGTVDQDKGGDVHQVETIIVHPDYDSEATNNDIALVKVKVPFEMGTNVRSIPLNTNRVRPGSIATVSGWGYLAGYESTDVLQKVNVMVIPKWECEWLYGREELTESMFCAGRAGRDSCQGDSGGPIIHDNYLIGIVSWGYGCGLPGYPGIYTDVHLFLDWIRENSGV